MALWAFAITWCLSLSIKIHVSLYKISPLKLLVQFWLSKIKIILDWAPLKNYGKELTFQLYLCDNDLLSIFLKFLFDMYILEQNIRIMLIAELLLQAIRIDLNKLVRSIIRLNQHCDVYFIINLYHI